MDKDPIDPLTQQDLKDFEDDLLAYIADATPTPKADALLVAMANRNDLSLCIALMHEAYYEMQKAADIALQKFAEIKITTRITTRRHYECADTSRFDGDC